MKLTKKEEDSILQYSKDIEIQKIIENLNKSKSKTLFILNNKNQLIGSITDGDIRRSILKYGSLKIKIDKIYNKKPINFLSYNKVKFDKIFKNKNINSIPILNSNKTIRQIIFSEQINKGMRQKNDVFLYNKIDVVIMAGGKGTRLKPFTSFLPKPMLPIDNKTIIDKIIESFLSLNSKKIFISINEKSKILQSYLTSIYKNKKLTYIKENKFLGTAGSLSLLKKKISEDFFVSNCDTFINVDYGSIYNFHKENKNIVTIVGCIINETSPYGECRIGKTGQLLKLIEKPSRNLIVNTGFYVFSSKALSNLKNNNYEDMNIFIEKLLKKKYKVGVFPIKEQDWNDMGDWEKYKKYINQIDYEK